MWIHLLPLGLIDGASGQGEAVAPPVVRAPGIAVRYPYSARIDGELVYFDSLETLQRLLAQYVKTAKKKTKKKAVTRIAKGVPVEVPYIEPPVQVPQWAVERIQQVNASMEVYYWAQYQRLIDQDDEDAITALYG